MKTPIIVTSAALVATLLTSSVIAEENHYEYVVIGAGAAGLSAAYRLDELDRDYIVLEKEERAGGIAENGVHGRFHYAKGTEYLGEPDGYLARVIDQLNIPVVEIPSPMDASFYQGKMYVGESKLASLTVEQSGEQEFQNFIDLLNSAEGMSYKQLKKLDGITAKQWLEENQVHPFIQQRYEVMARGLFGANLTDISALSFVPEAYFDYGDAKKVSELMMADEHSESWTVPTGIASIATNVATYLDPRVRYGSAVNKVTKSGNGYQVDFVSDGKKHSLMADKVIIATPAPVASYIAKAVLTQEQRNILEQVQYAQYATVALFSKTPIFNHSFDLAILDGDKVTDLYDATWVERHFTLELKNVKEYIASAYLAPKGVSDKTLLQNSDAEIMNIVFDEVSRIVPDVKNRVTGYDIKRFYHAYPVFNKGYFTRLHKLKSSLIGVYLAGDYMAYPTFDAAFESGYQAVQQAEEE